MQDFDHKAISRRVMQLYRDYFYSSYGESGIFQNTARQDNWATREIISLSLQLQSHTAPRFELQRTRCLNRRFLNILFDSLPGTRAWTQSNATSFMKNFTHKNREVQSTDSTLLGCQAVCLWLQQCFRSGFRTVYVGWPRWAEGWNQISKMKRATESGFLKLTAI